MVDVVEKCYGKMKGCHRESFPWIPASAISCAAFATLSQSCSLSSFDLNAGHPLCVEGLEPPCPGINNLKIM